jgi:DNA repair exonuclease SbcCD nuclease subunit
MSEIKVAHIADVHIRSLSRHDEYRQVFSAFAESVKADGVTHIFVGGDIFHTKTTGLSPEYIDFMTWWLKLLSSVVPK